MYCVIKFIALNVVGKLVDQLRPLYGLYTAAADLPISHVVQNETIVLNLLSIEK